MSISLPGKDVRLALVNLISSNPAKVARRQPGLAVRTLAGYLRCRTAATVGVFDMQTALDTQLPARAVFAEPHALDGALETTVAEIVRYSPDVIGLSMKWETLGSASHLVEKVKAAGLAPFFVLGSYLPTFAAGEILGVFHDALQEKRVVAVLGEGEEAMVDIFARMQSNGREVTAEDFEGVSNVRAHLDSSVEYRRVDLDDYPILTPENSPELFARAAIESARGSIPLESSRGCPWGHCTFCSLSGLYGPGLGMRREFSVQHVLGRMRAYAESGARRFYFIDSEFLGKSRSDEEFMRSLERAEEIARGVMALNDELGLQGDARISISTFPARVDIIYHESNPGRNRRANDMLALLKEAGFRHAYLGIESGSPRQLRRFGKGVAVGQNAGAKGAIEASGLGVEIGFIFFDPLATMEDLRENVAFIRRNNLQKADARILGELGVYAGSPMQTRLKNEGLISGGLDLASLTYPYEYQDIHVKLVRDIFMGWETQTRLLTRILANFAGLPQVSQEFPEIVSTLRELDFELVEQLCKVSYAELLQPECRSRILGAFTPRLEAVLQKLEGIEKERLPQGFDKILEETRKAMRVFGNKWLR
ncbi:MAG: radical SAM protein [Candidatus Margulisiibacteriota bacterium]